MVMDGDYQESEKHRSVGKGQLDIEITEIFFGVSHD